MEQEGPRRLATIYDEIGKQKLYGEDTRFLPGEESCKEARRRTGLDTITNNLRL